MRLARYTEVPDSRIELLEGEFRFVPEDDMHSMLKFFVLDVSSRRGW